MTEALNRETPRLYTVKDFVKAGHYPNEGGLRGLIFYAYKNGFKKVIKRINRKIFIDVEAFYQWVNEINEGEVK